MSDDFLFRSLLRGSTPVPRLVDSDRYAKGLYSSYLHRADEALLGARPLAATASADAWRAIGRALQNLFKAIRIAHRLSATRRSELRVLLHGDATVPGLPDDSVWKARLAPMVAWGGPSSPSVSVRAAIESIERAIADALAIDPPRARLATRTRASPRASRPPRAE